MPKDQQATTANTNTCTVHKIRLHGPWECEPIAHTELNPDGKSIDLPKTVPPPGTVKIPTDWASSLGPEFRGRVLYTRRFGQPTNLEPNERIALVIEQISGFAVVRLNGDDLVEIEMGVTNSRIELLDALKRRNELEIEVNLPQGSELKAPGGIVGDVYLEIYEVQP